LHLSPQSLIKLHHHNQKKHGTWDQTLAPTKCRGFWSLNCYFLFSHLICCSLLSSPISAKPNTTQCSSLLVHNFRWLKQKWSNSKIFSSLEINQKLQKYFFHDYVFWKLMSHRASRIITLGPRAQGSPLVHIKVKPKLQYLISKYWMSFSSRVEFISLLFPSCKILYHCWVVLMIHNHGIQKMKELVLAYRQSQFSNFWKLEIIIPTTPYSLHDENHWFFKGIQITGSGSSLILIFFQRTRTSDSL
jgi:hypothetical protein